MTGIPVDISVAAHLCLHAHNGLYDSTADLGNRRWFLSIIIENRDEIISRNQRAHFTIGEGKGIVCVERRSVATLAMVLNEHISLGTLHKLCGKQPFYELPVEVAMFHPIEKAQVVMRHLVEAHVHRLSPLKLNHREG